MIFKAECLRACYYSDRGIELYLIYLIFTHCYVLELIYAIQKCINNEPITIYLVDFFLKSNYWCSDIINLIG